MGFNMDCLPPFDRPNIGACFLADGPSCLPEKLIQFSHLSNCHSTSIYLSIFPSLLPFRHFPCPLNLTFSCVRTSFHFYPSYLPLITILQCFPSPTELKFYWIHLLLTHILLGLVSIIKSTTMNTCTTSFMSICLNPFGELVFPYRPFLSFYMDHFVSLNVSSRVVRMGNLQAALDWYVKLHHHLH